jgi:hypothetical protein
MYHNILQSDAGRCPGSSDHLEDNKSYWEDSRYPNCKVLNLLDNIRLPFDNRSEWSYHNNLYHKESDPLDRSLQDEQLKQEN